MAKDSVFLSVVIPAYNEERRIVSTVESVVSYCGRLGRTWEIVVVNDGSSDKTARLVRQLARRIPVVFVDNHENKGKGAVVNQGMRIARGDVALFMDADSATRIQEFDKMLPLFAQGFDVVIGSRRLSGSRIVKKQPLVRELGGKLFGWTVHALFGLPFTDTQAGFKAFSREARELVFSAQRTFAWAFDVELLVLARRFGLRMAQVPIRWEDQAESRVKPLGMAKAFFDLVRLKVLYH